jgi:nitrogen regulatory protein P-II 1
MKEIKAIIQPFALGPVLEGLRQLGNLPAVTVSTVQGISIIHPEFALQERIKLEIMVPESLVESLLQAIQKHARTGKPGDGRIFVLPVEDMVKIRTGERNNAT